MITIHLDIEPFRAEALAQFLKRASWDTFRRHARDDEEAYAMIDAVNALRDELARNGYNPR